MSESTIAIYGPAGHAILTAARITLTNGVDVFPDGRLELDTPQP